MSIPGRLTYLSMFAFLEAYCRRTGSDEIGAFLGDLQLGDLKLDGVDEPLDPATIQDWGTVGERAREEGEALARARTTGDTDCRLFR